MRFLIVFFFALMTLDILLEWEVAEIYFDSVLCYLWRLKEGFKLYRINMFEFWNRQPADPFFNKSGLFLSSPWPVHILLVTYLLYVLKFGKKFMENRKPYNVKNIVLVYNIIQVIFNVILFGFAFYYILLHRIHDFRCMKALPFDHPIKNIERWGTYAYFVNKVLDLMDTVFFVLRKSYRQITFLHVYHHVLMVAGTYWVMWFFGFGGQYYTMALLNTFVHACMYFYYFLTMLKPEMKTKLWLKKSITIMQIVQFIICLFQSFYVLLFNPTCEFPLFLQFMQFLQSCVMIYMFGNFYLKAYMKPEQQKSKNM